MQSIISARIHTHLLSLKLQDEVSCSNSSDVEDKAGVGQGPCSDGSRSPLPLRHDDGGGRQHLDSVRGVPPVAGLPVQVLAQRHQRHQDQLRRRRLRRVPPPALQGSLFSNMIDTETSASLTDDLKR